jgi:nucleoside phosphorylase
MGSAQSIVSVAFALDAEFAPWRARRMFAAATDPACFEATIGPGRVRAAIVGIRARRLAQVSPWLLDASVDAVIVAGLAGALSPVHRVGDVLAARHICRDGEQRAADPHLVALAGSCGAAIVERFLTSDHVAGTAAAKRRLASAADTIDMESFDVVDAAQRRGMAALAIRVIGDAAADDIPLDVEPAITSDGSLSALTLAGSTIARPWRWPRLIRFGIEQRRALGALFVVLDALTASLGRQS